MAEISKKAIAGEMTQGEKPVWEPLVWLVGEHHTDGFMWMFEVTLADGTALHAYKHRDTRGYIHMTADGRAFYFTEKGKYRQIEVLEAIQAAMRAVFRTPTYYFDPEFKWEHERETAQPEPEFEGPDIPF